MYLVPDPSFWFLNGKSGYTAAKTERAPKQAMALRPCCGPLTDCISIHEEAKVTCACRTTKQHMLLMLHKDYEQERVACCINSGNYDIIVCSSHCWRTSVHCLYPIFPNLLKLPETIAVHRACFRIWKCHLEFGLYNHLSSRKLKAKVILQSKQSDTSKEVQAVNNNCDSEIVSHWGIYKIWQKDSR